MKKLILSSIMVLLATMPVSSQNCSQLKVGMKMTFEVTSYPILLEKEGAAFFSLKQKEKDKKIEAYKNQIAEGKVAPKSVTSMVYTITAITPEGDYELSITLSDNKVYKSYLACKDGNFYILRSKGPVPLVTGNDTIGHLAYGAQIVPITLKVGDNTPGYIDEIVTSSAGKSTYTSSFFAGDGSGNIYQGYVPVTYNFEVSSKTLKFYQGGTVLAEDKTSVSGTDYTSYVISTEIWSKTDKNANIEIEKETYFNDPALSKQINKQVKKSFEKGGKKLEAKLNQYTGANEQGYVVTYKEEWVIPGLTVAKTINYDVYGIINSVLVLKSIE